MRVDETRRDRPAAGVEPGEPAERVALRLERGLDRVARPDRERSGPPSMATTGRSRRARSTGVGRRRATDLGLVGARPHAAGHRHDLAGPDDEQARASGRRCGRPR